LVGQQQTINQDDYGQSPENQKDKENQMTIVKRGSTYHLDSVIAGTRHRCSLGTSDAKAASRLENRIAFALADGPHSPTWTELRSALPVSSFKRLTQGVLPEEPLATTLAGLEECFYTHTERREKLGQIGALTRKSYDRTTKLFFDRALDSGLKKVTDLTSEFVEAHLLWRKESILSKGGSGRGIIADSVVLSALFDFAVEEGWLDKTPLRYKPKIPAVEEAVQPFTIWEMDALEAVPKSALEAVVFAVFKHTGLRCGDVASLRWAAIDWETKTLRTLTAKRGKRVEIPMSQDFVRIMDGFRIEGEDRVFPNMVPFKLYKMFRSWGEKARVANCHPHRMRHSFVCQMLAKGLTLFDVAQLIGDTTAVTEKHYAKWTNGQQERVRGMMEAA
jgi:integrase